MKASRFAKINILTLLYQMNFPKFNYDTQEWMEGHKVIPEKAENVRHYVGKWLQRKGIKLLGVLPYDRTLAYPLISSINPFPRKYIPQNC